ncbi:MAG: hypothetical protein Q7J60_20905 [Bradyrhizobium sp.]|nr:hypothetical protein [Bradyrhizobium sp.]
MCAALSASEHDPEKACLALDADGHRFSERIMHETDESAMMFRTDIIGRKRHQFKAGSGNAPA